MTASGKKLWELLITSSDGKMRFLKTMQSSVVNSKTVREGMEQCLEEVSERGGKCKVGG